MKKQYKLDVHAHGPWTSFFTEPEGIFRWSKKKIMNSWFPHPKTIDPLVETYLPHLKDGNAAIGLCSYTVDRFGKVMKPLEEASERNRLKSKYSLKDIVLEGDYFAGFKTNEDRELYFINAQEIMVPEAHAVILPVTKPLAYKDENKKYRSFGDVANEAKNLEVPALIFPTHPCYNPGLVGKAILWASLEASWKDLGMNPETLEYYAQEGVLDGIEVWNSHAGKEKNEKEIYPESSRIADKYGIPKIASSDTSTPKNILTSYVKMNLDFSDPMKLTEGIRNDLRDGKYEMKMGTPEGSFWISLQHLAANWIMRYEKKRLIQ